MLEQALKELRKEGKLQCLKEYIALTDEVLLSFYSKSDNVTSSTTTQHSKKIGLQSKSSHEPVCIVPSEAIPAGTTWIFEDGSQVSSSRLGGSDDGDNQGN